jgi:hypothetical protein
MAAKRTKAGETTYITRSRPLPHFVIWPNVDFSQVTRVEFRHDPVVSHDHYNAMLIDCRPTTLCFIGKMYLDPEFVNLVRHISDNTTDVWLDPAASGWSTWDFTIFHRELGTMYKLRHLHVSADFCQQASSQWWWSLGGRTQLEELTLGGPYDPQVAHTVLHQSPSLRTLYYPDLATLPCPDHRDGWAAHLAATAPSFILARLEPALQHRIRSYQKQQVDAIAQVLPVVGVPELVAALAFKFRAPGDWAELNQQTE